MVLVVTVVLPDAGYRDGIVVPSIKALFVEQIRQIMDVRIILELPITVEELEPVGAFTMLYQVVPAGGCRNVVGTLGHGSFMRNLQVFVGRRNYHSLFLLCFGCAVHFLALLYALFCEKGIN